MAEKRGRNSPPFWFHNRLKEKNRMANSPLARKKLVQEKKMVDQVRATTDKVTDQIKDTGEKVAGQVKQTTQKVTKAVRARVNRREKKTPWYAYLTAVPAVVLVYLLFRKQRREDRFAPRMVPATGTGASGSTWGPGAPQGTSPAGIQAGAVQASSRSEGFGQSVAHLGAQIEAAGEDVLAGQKPSEFEPGHAAQTAQAASSDKPDDLAMIEGIGPKISRLLAKEGIRTFNDLAEADPTRLEQILRANNLPMANPSTWPAQARMIANGEWDRFNVLRDQLSAGRPNDTREA
jgi:predicted flap endonuclease-1-like 5' DNA nuclease